MKRTLLLFVAIMVISGSNPADACVNVYRLDRYGQKHLVRTEFCYRDDCPYYQKWKNATVEKVYDHDIAPSKPVNRSSTADLEIPKKSKKKSNAGIKIVNAFRSIFGKKKI